MSRSKWLVIGALLLLSLAGCSKTKITQPQNGNEFHLPFSDSFNDGDDSDWSWYTSIGPNPAGWPSHEVVNGVEKIVTHDQNNTLLANGTSTLSDYYVSAVLRIRQLLDDACGGLKIYAYDNGGIGQNSSYYVFEICFRENRWSLKVHYSNGTSEILAHGIRTINIGSWYRMELKVRGGTIYAYLNGRRLGQGTPSRALSGGYFGFGGSDDIIEIDNVYVGNSK